MRAASSGAFEPSAVTECEALVSHEALAFARTAAGLAQEEVGEAQAAVAARAREAARLGISLDRMLRRMLQDQAAAVDRIVEVVVSEYEGQVRARSGLAKRWPAEQVKRFLASNRLPSEVLGYQLAGCHVAFVSGGAAAGDHLRGLAGSYGMRSLLVETEDEVFWGWLGSRRPIAPDELDRLIQSAGQIAGLDGPCCFGEAGEGPAGWRLSHLQARAALPCAKVLREAAVRYGEVALLAAVLKEETLAATLAQLFLAPFARAKVNGKILKATALAYFEAGGNVSAAAASMGVNRHTAGSRLRRVEELLGRPIHRCGPALYVALRLDAAGWSGSLP